MIISRDIWNKKYSNSGANRPIMMAFPMYLPVANTEHHTIYNILSYLSVGQCKGLRSIGIDDSDYYTLEELAYLDSIGHYYTNDLTCIIFSPSVRVILINKLSNDKLFDFIYRGVKDSSHMFTIFISNACVSDDSSINMIFKFIQFITMVILNANKSVPLNRGTDGNIYVVLPEKYNFNFQDAIFFTNFYVDVFKSMVKIIGVDVIGDFDNEFDNLIEYDEEYRSIFKRIYEYVIKMETGKIYQNDREEFLSIVSEVYYNWV